MSPSSPRPGRCWSPYSICSTERRCISPTRRHREENESPAGGNAVTSYFFGIHISDVRPPHRYRIAISIPDGPPLKSLSNRWDGRDAAGLIDVLTLEIEQFRARAGDTGSTRDISPVAVEFIKANSFSKLGFGQMSITRTPITEEHPTDWPE